jgi:NADPH:quinone reductase-like Zn-dependent oxidoreductase
MKACFFRKYGGPEVLEYGDWPDPAPSPGEVLVDIHAASVNAADWKMRAGQYGAQIKLPHVPGRDFSGVVSAVGQGANDFKVGDAVFAVCEVPREGAYAEKIAIRQDIVARKPEGLSHAQTAAIGLAGLTALISIEETLKLKAGETILIQGGAGGVAGFAIALAKHLGARVISTASAANHAYVRSLGADEVIDYRAEDFTRRGPYDLILDLVAHRSVFAYRRALARGGVYRCVGGSVRSLLRVLTVGAVAGRVTGRSLGVLVVPQGPAHFESVAARCAAGEVDVRIDRTFALDDVPAALAYVGAGRACGKVVVEVA